MSSPQHDLKVLISSYHSLIVIENAEEERILHTLRSVAGQLNLDFMEWSSAQGLSGSISLSNPEDSLSAEATLNFIKEHNEPVIVWLKDFAKELENKVVARLLQDVVKKFNNSQSAVIISGAHIALGDEFKNNVIKFDLSFPTHSEYRHAIEGVFESMYRSHKAKFELSEDEMAKFLDLLRGMTLQQARQIAAQAFLTDNTFDGKDLSLVEQKKVQVIKEDGLLEYYPPNQNAYELGGFENLKKWLKKMEAGFSEEARALKLPKPKGVLFVGVPGCGKSLAAKYVARLWRLPLLKLDAGRLFDKYIGESEKNFRHAIKLSESVSPSILWIDEIEKSIAMPSGGSDMDGGVSKRMFGAFLTWLQEKEAPVFVVATANDLHALPAELLRKGRFDEIFFVDLPNAAERAEIFKIHLGFRKLDVDVDKLSELTALTEGFSGSEIEQAVVGASLTAIQEKVKISMNLLKREIQNLIPLSKSREEYISGVRAKGSEFRPVN